MYLTCLICILISLYIHIERNKMIKNIFKLINKTYKFINGFGFDNVDPHLVRYFRTEYGKDWQSALAEHLYKKGTNNDKKAA